jgi:hypothetical protein
MKRLIIAGIALAAFPVLAQTSAPGANAAGPPGANTTGSPTGGTENRNPSTTPGSAAMSTSSITSESQARSRLESNGYSNVMGLSRDSNGMWHGRAMKGTTQMQVRVDQNGNIIAQ